MDDAEYRHRAEQARAAVAVQQVELLKVEEEARVAREQFDQFRRRSGNESDPDESPLAQWRPQLEAAQAAVERSRAVLAEAELLLSRTEVTAPFDAVVRSEDIAAGRHVAAGMGVGRVFASDAVEIAVPLTDDDAALIPGLWEAGSSGRRIPVRVFADHGDSRYVWEGRVDRVEAVLDESTRTLNVIARIPNPFSGGSPVGEEEASGSPPLLVGQFVDVEITGRASEPYFRIRRLALQPGNQVWVVEGGSVSIVPVPRAAAPRRHRPRHRGSRGWSGSDRERHPVRNRGDAGPDRKARPTEIRNQARRNAEAVHHATIEVEPLPRLGVLERVVRSQLSRDREPGDEAGLLGVDEGVRAASARCVSAPG